MYTKERCMTFSSESSSDEKIKLVETVLPIKINWTKKKKIRASARGLLRAREVCVFQLL